MLKLFRTLPLLALCAGGLFAQKADESTTRLLRFPATNGTEITFSYAGQLYTVDAKGGTARRLTDGPGYAIFPRYSADGKQLAFTAQYDGNTEVYTMPAQGGTPKRLTTSATLDRDDMADRMGPNNVVMGWRNTASEVVFRSRWRTFNPFIGELFTVGMDGDVPAQIPVPRGGFVSYSPDDTKIAYNRVFREFRTWKNYRGGMADDIWIFDLKSGALENITNNPAQDIFPMWAANGKVYFVSERTGRANLFSYELASKKTAQLTSFTEYDVKFPSLGRDSVVFEQAGQIWKLDLATGKSAVVPIVVREDSVSARPALVNVSKFTQSLDLSPDAQRVTVVARGDVFTAPAKDGAIRNLTQSNGVHDRDAVWSPDGKSIAYFSDATGEFEIYVRAQDGKGAAVQLTKDADSYPSNLQWSPDSKKLSWADRKQRLRFVTVETKAVTTVVENPDSPVAQYAWAPDSQWIAWVKQAPSAAGKLILFSIASGKSIEATDGWYDVNSPTFSDDGKWLLFASSRDFNPIYSDTEWNHAYQNMERVYLLALAKDTASPFAPKSDEVAIEEEKKDSEAKPDATKADAAKPENKAADADKKPAAKKTVVVKVDADGLTERILGLPIPASNYSSIHMLGEKVYYRRVPGGPVTGGGGGEGFGAGRATRSVLAFYNLKERKETELGNFDGFDISANGKKMLIRSGRDYSLIDLPAAKVELKPEQKLDLSGLEMRLNRQAEWTQIFNESWRQMRDFFYAPNMHGVDWPAQQKKYAALLPSVTNRNDLTYVIGEMISELHIGHAYVGVGDRPDTPKIKTGLLGAQVSRDKASRAYRIDKILHGENWQTKTRSPLTEMGVNVKAGDFILAVNGKPVSELDNLYTALIGTVGKQVVLRVNGKSSDEGARDITIVPIGDEAPLYYEEFVQKNIDYVAKKTDGKVGYLHIPDMGPEGLNEFVRRFYPQLSRQALVIDVRGNGGGNVSPMIIERLRRELAMINVRRNGTPAVNPGQMLLGPKVTLLNEYSASDGDLFPYRFRESGLGKLVGKRSWGGVVGISGSLPFTDGGSLNKPEFAPYSKDGKSWVIEGHGVDPDIVVDNDPAREFKGEDQQLDKAIEVVVEELKTKGQALPPPPAWPVKLDK
ncbi:S41 family peptidase [Oleiharenicola lentus]|uniref:S41 family peptidase n=1 Tax=Oleiharenicola lentus TaxID=2508720 RepID=UPI003F67CB24